MLPGRAKVVKAGSQPASDFQVLVSDADALLQSTVAYSGESLRAARARFRDTLESFKGRVADAQSAAIGTVNEAARATDDYVRGNPWKMVGVAAAVGLVVAAVLLHKK